MKPLFLSLFFCLCLVTNYAQDFALKQLEQSPRHSEWVELANGSRKLKCFVVFPEVATKATAIMAIQPRLYA